MFSAMVEGWIEGGQQVLLFNPLACDLSFNYEPQVVGKHNGNNMTHDMERKFVYIHITIYLVG